jgi:hypothetical protein
MSSDNCWGYYSEDEKVCGNETNTPIIYPEIEDYTDYEISTQSKLKTTAHIIGVQAEKTAQAIEEEITGAYKFAKFVPVVLLVAVVYRVIK